MSRILVVDLLITDFCQILRSEAQMRSNLITRTGFTETVDGKQILAGSHKQAPTARNAGLGNYNPA